MWVLRYIWDTEEQQDVLASIVADTLAGASDEEQAVSHPRSRGTGTPDPERLARDLERISARLGGGEIPAADRSYLRDQLGVLAARCQWVQDEQQRGFLEDRVNTLLDRLGGES